MFQYDDPLWGGLRNHQLAALFLLSYMHHQQTVQGGIEPHLSAFYLKLPRVLGVMTSENDNG